MFTLKLFLLLFFFVNSGSAAFLKFVCYIVIRLESYVFSFEPDFQSLTYVDLWKFLFQKSRNRLKLIQLIFYPSNYVHLIQAKDFQIKLKVFCLSIKICVWAS